MKEVIELENKEVRVIIANYLGIKTDDVVPNRYSFSIKGMSAEEIKNKINNRG